MSATSRHNILRSQVNIRRSNFETCQEGMRIMSWTEQKIQMLKDMWGHGYSASEIAKRLGGFTRNAVIGKAHRLKLSSRPSPIKREEDGRTPGGLPQGAVPIVRTSSKKRVMLRPLPPVALPSTVKPSTDSVT